MPERHQGLRVLAGASLLLRGHCPQSNLWANRACSQFNLFKLVSESNPAAHKHLLQAYYVRGMALKVLWLTIHAEVESSTEVKTDPSVSPDTSIHELCHRGTVLSPTELPLPICKRNITVVLSHKAVAGLGGRACHTPGTAPGTTDPSAQ